MLRQGLIIAFCVAVAAGCGKPFFQNDLAFSKNGNKYDFRVSVVKDVLYISCKLNGVEIDGDSGRSVTGKSITRVTVTDLNADGYPELYVFYDSSTSVPDICALTCNERFCSQIGIQGAAGGPAPENYCGEDSYSIENDLIVRKYRLCKKAAPAGDGFGIVAYKLSQSSFGNVLNIVE